MPKTAQQVSNVSRRQFEPSWNISLENPGWIILLAESLKIGLARCAVRSNRVLEVRGIIEVLVPVEQFCSFRSLLNATDQYLSHVVDILIITRLAPGNFKQAQHQGTR